jgi:hypothetical protein
MRPSQKLNQERNNKIVDMYKSGVGIAEIQTRLGPIDKRTIRSALKSAGVHVTQWAELPQPTYSELSKGHRRVGSLLRLMRGHLSLTVMEAAAGLAMTHMAVVRLENAQLNLTLLDMMKLADTYGLPLYTPPDVLKQNEQAYVAKYGKAPTFVDIYVGLMEAFMHEGANANPFIQKLVWDHNKFPTRQRDNHD